MCSQQFTDDVASSDVPRWPEILYRSPFFELEFLHDDYVVDSRFDWYPRHNTVEDNAIGRSRFGIGFRPKKRNKLKLTKAMKRADRHSEEIVSKADQANDAINRVVQYIIDECRDVPQVPIIDDSPSIDFYELQVGKTLIDDAVDELVNQSKLASQPSLLGIQSISRSIDRP